MGHRGLVPVLVLATGLLVVLAPAALAHPFFDPSEAPAAGTTELTLEIAHGCGPDESADTIEVAVDPPDGDVLAEVTPRDEDGWTLDVERGDDDELTFVYTADGGAEPAPTFDLEVTTAGDEDDAGDTLYWRVFQDCGDAGSFRWIGTPDDEADDPAVTLDLVAPEPGAGDAATEPTGEASPTPAPTPSPTPSPTDSPSPTAAATPAGEADGTSPWPLVVGGLVVLAVLGAVVWSLVRQRTA